MTSRDFRMWLDGFMAAKGALSKADVETIQRKSAEVVDPPVCPQYVYSYPWYQPPYYSPPTWTASVSAGAIVSLPIYASTSTTITQ